MIKKIILVFICTFFLFGCSVDENNTVQAETEILKYTSQDGDFSFDYNGSWILTEKENDKSFSVSLYENKTTFTRPSLNVFKSEFNGTPEDFARIYIESVLENELIISKVTLLENTTLKGYDAYKIRLVRNFRFVEQAAIREMITVQRDDTNYILVFETSKDDFDSYSSVSKSFFDSFEFN